MMKNLKPSKKRRANLPRQPMICFHCGEPVPAGLDLTAEIDGQPQPMCCLGCRAVAAQIEAFGLSDYYRRRTELPETPRELVPDDLKNLSIFNNPQLQSGFVTERDGKRAEARLIIDGITCPACVWLIDSRLSRMPGVSGVEVNYSTQRCSVAWQKDHIGLGEILAEITRLGYRPFPFNPEQREQRYEKERKNQLIRIGIAGLFGMQVMMIAIALYFGEASGMAERYRRFLHGISLLLTLPVLLYSARPIFAGAWRDLRIRRPGMDIPVALAIAIAFSGSVIATAGGAGHVYYDSIVMFVFFILCGRFLEFSSRKKSSAELERMTPVLPLYANKITASGALEVTPLTGLAVNDRILVKPGELIPVDGVIAEGASTVNEAIVTGESLPLAKQAGMKVIGGSANVESPLQIRVTRLGEQGTLSNIARMIEQAAASQTRHLLLADKVVSGFIVFILLLAFATGVYWHNIDPGQWLPITIAVLVVSCPCALSLATPTALASAAAALMKHGVAIVNSDAPELLGKTTCFVFDKTGTLTEGRLALEHIDIFAPGYNRAEVIGLAQALERHSEHPVARAICQLDPSRAGPAASRVRNAPGRGLSGLIDGAEWFIGARAFIAEQTGLPVERDHAGLRHILLANKQEIVAGFFFKDRLRAVSPALIQFLRAQGKKIILMSGDHPQIVRQIAAELGIQDSRAEYRPEDKLKAIAALQRQGEVICMVGDGINDAPAFARADIAIAMTEASEITKLNADLVLLNHRIDTLKILCGICARTNRTIRANFAWALGYNLTALPFAGAGLLSPWMAALGMSLSSLVVVINASRIATRRYA